MDIKSPSYIKFIADTPWMQAVSAMVTMTQVPDGTLYSNQPQDAMSLSSPIAYERTILYPDNDYFLVVDRMEGTQPWIYRVIFRPSSLSITPTTSSSKIGNVNGALSIGGSSYNWLNIPYNSERYTNINTSSVMWSSSNPDGKKSVQMNLYSVPSSNVVFEKIIGRVAGYSQQNGSYTSDVEFRQDSANNLYRVTAVMSGYSGQTLYTTSTLPVTGIGNALKAVYTDHYDIAYTGKGKSTFGNFSTDADTVFVRVRSSPAEYTIVNGTYLSFGGSSLVNLSSKAAYFTYKINGSKSQIELSSNGLNMRLGMLNSSATYTVLMDGAVYSNWAMVDNRTIQITVGAGEHTIELSSVQVSPTPIRDGMVLWYDMNLTGGKLTDLSNSSNTGMPYNTSYTLLPTGAGTLNFNGTSSYVRCNDSPTLDTTSGLSIEVMFKLNTLGTLQTLASKSMSSPTGSGYTLWVDKSNRLEFIAYDRNNNKTALDIIPNFSTGTWYHVVATDDGKNITLYVNGNVSGSTPCDGLSPSMLNLTIGRYSSSGIAYLKPIPGACPAAA